MESDLEKHEHSFVGLLIEEGYNREVPDACGIVKENFCILKTLIESLLLIWKLKVIQKQLLHVIWKILSV